MPYNIPRETPEITAKMERCVNNLINNPKFKPRNPKQTKKEAAIATCKASIMKSMSSEINDINLQAQYNKMFFAQEEGGSKDEAIQKAKQLGCQGTHTKKVNGRIIYMPCFSHIELLRVKGKSKENNNDNLPKSTIHKGGKLGNVQIEGKRDL